ncbi:MAG: phospho-sugar mutase, partial [Acidimicrobiia bacterium]
TLTGFKWIVNAGLTLEKEGKGRFIFGYEEALGYTVGSTVRDKDGMSAALIFTDLVADLAESGRSLMDYLSELWAGHRMWVSAQTSIVRPGSTGVESLRRAVGRLADHPPSQIGGIEATRMTDYRKNAHQRPPWLGEHPLLEFSLGNHGRVLVRPSGTEPKLKIYVDLCEAPGEDPSAQHEALTARAGQLGQTLGESLGL